MIRDWISRTRAALVLALLVGSACTSATSTEQDEDSLSPLEELLSEDSSADPKANRVNNATDASDEADKSTGRESVADQMVRAEIELEETTAVCMRKQGFEYTPVDRSEEIREFFETSNINDGSRDWTAEWGFGISTERFTQAQVGPALLGFQPNYDDELPTAEDQVHPDAEYLDSLDEATRAAYYKALHGDLSFDETLTDEEQQSALLEQGGCRTEAYKAQSGDKYDFYIKFGDEMREIEESALQDPAVAERADEIGRCVNGKGFEMPDGWPNHTHGLFAKDLDAIEESLWGDDGAPYPSDEETRSRQMTSEEMDAIQAEVGKLREIEMSDAQKQQLASIQKKEIELALAIFDCGGGRDEAEQLLREIRNKYEEKFIEANRDKLDD